MDTQTTGFVIWLTGMNRAGKSTLAAHLAKRLAAAGRSVVHRRGRRCQDAAERGSAPARRTTRAVARLGFVAKAVARAEGSCAALVPRRAGGAPQGGAASSRCSRTARWRSCSSAIRRASTASARGRAEAGAGRGRPLRAADACGRDGPHRRDPGRGRHASSRRSSISGSSAGAGSSAGSRRLRPRWGKPARAARGGARRKLVAKAAGAAAPEGRRAAHEDREAAPLIGGARLCAAARAGKVRRHVAEPRRPPPRLRAEARAPEGIAPRLRRLLVAFSGE